MEYRLNELINWAKHNQTQINYMWVSVRPIRPKGIYGLKRRISAAWKVLTGKADAVIWPAGQ